MKETSLILPLFGPYIGDNLVCLDFLTKKQIQCLIEITLKPAIFAASPKERRSRRKKGSLGVEKDDALSLSLCSWVIVVNHCRKLIITAAIHILNGALILADSKLQKAKGSWTFFFEKGEERNF